MSNQFLQLISAMSLWKILGRAANRVAMLFEKRRLPVDRVKDHHIRAIRLGLALEIVEKICAYAAVTLLFVDPHHFDMRAVPAVDTRDDFALIVRDFQEYIFFFRTFLRRSDRV